MADRTRSRATSRGKAGHQQLVIVGVLVPHRGHHRQPDRLLVQRTPGRRPPDSTAAPHPRLDHHQIRRPALPPHRALPRCLRQVRSRQWVRQARSISWSPSAVKRSGRRSRVAAR